MELRHDLCGGAFVRSDAARHAEIVSPRSEEVIGRVPLATAADVHRAVEAARRAFDHGEWPRLSPAERAAAMRRLADCLDRRHQELSRTIGTGRSGVRVTLIRISSGLGLPMSSLSVLFAKTCVRSTGSLGSPLPFTAGASPARTTSGPERREHVVGSG